MPGSYHIAHNFVSTLRALPHGERLAVAKQILGEDVVTLTQVKHLMRVSAVVSAWRLLFAMRHSHCRIGPFTLLTEYSCLFSHLLALWSIVAFSSCVIC